MNTRPRFDAIVIGSGAGGATLALRLAQQGVKTLIVERGASMRPVSRNGSPGVYIDDMRHAPTDSFAGGLTKFYGAALYRMREDDFRETEHEAGISPGWPIGLADLEPYYAEAECLYKVHGQAGRERAAFPHPALPHHPVLARMEQRLQRHGSFTSAIPRALDYGPGRPCVLCADCDAHVCTLNAKMDAETAALRPALATGHAELWTKADCMRVEMSADGRRATGAWIRHKGEPVLVSSDAVILCAGIEGTPQILRRSATARDPAGLGNAGGALGRYLAGHSAGMVFPLVSFFKLPPIHSKTLAIHPSPADEDWPEDLGSIQAAGQIPLWRKTEAILKPAARLMARKRRPYLWHEVGTARMGTDPSDSVVDANCKVHGIEGLFATDASSMPSAGSVNTALTIMALALRTADHIAGDSRIKFGALAMGKSDMRPGDGV